MARHKHADLIHAWADGAEIQVWQKHTGQWIDWRKPTWGDDMQYRIKPEEKKPVVRWLWAHKNEYGQLISSTVFATEKEAAMNRTTFIKLEWSRTEFPE